jgi:hypothetical protein
MNAESTIKDTLPEWISASCSLTAIFASFLGPLRQRRQPTPPELVEYRLPLEGLTEPLRERLGFGCGQ